MVFLVIQFPVKYSLEVHGTTQGESFRQYNGIEYN